MTGAISERASPPPPPHPPPLGSMDPSRKRYSRVGHLSRQPAAQRTMGVGTATRRRPRFAPGDRSRLAPNRSAFIRACRKRGEPIQGDGWPSRAHRHALVGPGVPPLARSMYLGRHPARGPDARRGRRPEVQTFRNSLCSVMIVAHDDVRYSLDVPSETEPLGPPPTPTGPRPERSSPSAPFHSA
jgi:hypothetical protein